MISSKIIELKTNSEFLKAYPIIKQLRPHLNENSYIELILAAQVEDNYKMFALVEEDILVAVIGFKPMITLSTGRYIWICDLVTDSKQRSKGYGEKLLTYVEEWGKEKEFNCVSLSSGIQRIDAHRFYEDKMNYKKVNFVFKKIL
ncbi:GNAT family N-acetyltransferase [Bacillus salitolerans]|uniref:GNAT family N-acetyltransferase n=1 Tax=Bacillus salitolerans TaxID=1437434 RepID=A0ABW4LT00_9BACI